VCRGTPGEVTEKRGTGPNRESGFRGQADHRGEEEKPKRVISSKGRGSRWLSTEYWEEEGWVFEGTRLEGRTRRTHSARDRRDHDPGRGKEKGLYVFLSSTSSRGKISGNYVNEGGTRLMGCETNSGGWQDRRRGAATDELGRNNRRVRRERRALRKGQGGGSA